jgi:RNA polymerase sigma factor (sigma-70 family)
LLTLVATAVRWALVDSFRHYCGPYGIAAHTTLAPADTVGTGLLDRGDQTDQREWWNHLHEQIHRLPESEAEVCRLVWFSDLTVVDAATKLGVSRKTAQRRLDRARARLRQAIGDECPPA